MLTLLYLFSLLLRLFTLGAVFCFLRGILKTKKFLCFKSLKTIYRIVSYHQQGKFVSIKIFLKLECLDKPSGIHLIETEVEGWILMDREYFEEFHIYVGKAPYFIHLICEGNRIASSALRAKEKH